MGITGLADGFLTLDSESSSKKTSRNGSFLMICGLSLFAFYLQRSTLSSHDFQQQIALHADRTMPQFIVQELPHGISGLIVAGLLAAAMSGLSSGMSAITSVIISGFRQPLNNFRIFKKALLLERLIGVTVGAVGVSLAVGITFGMRGNDWNLVELSGRVVNLFVGPLAVLFFSGMLLRRATSTSVVLGFIFSTAVSIFISYSKQLFGLQSVSFTWVIPASFVGGFVATAIISYLLNARPEVSAHMEAS